MRVSAEISAEIAAGIIFAGKRKAAMKIVSNYGTKKG